MSDELAADGRILWSLFRVSPFAAVLEHSPHTETFAARAGCSVASLRAWLRGEGAPPPHQARVIVLAVLSRREEMALAGAAQRASSVPPDPAEYTLAGAEKALEGLRAEFPAWDVQADGLSTLGTGRPKLIWLAERGEVRFSGVTARELRGKLSAQQVWRCPRCGNVSPEGTDCAKCAYTAPRAQASGKVA